RARDRSEVDAARTGESPREWRGLNALARSARGCGDRHRSCRGSAVARRPVRGRGRFLLARGGACAWLLLGHSLLLGPDPRYPRADSQGLSLVDQGAQDALLIRWIVHRRLVRLDLDEVFSAGHVLAFGLQPVQDRPLLLRTG